MKTDRLIPLLPAVLLLALSGAAAPAPAVGQEAGTLTFTAGAGIGIPVGDLGDVSGVGPAFHVGTEYALSPSAGILASIDAEVFGSVTGPGGEGPTVRLFRLVVGPAYTLVHPEADRGLRVDVHGGVGGTAFSAGRTFVGTGANVRTIDLDAFYFGLGGGLSAGYAFSRTASAFLDAGASLSFADEEDTEVFTFLDPDVDAFSTLVSVPLTVGIRLSFPR